MKCFYPYERSVYFNRSRVGEPPFSSSVRNCENCSHFVNSESEKSNVKKWEKIRSRGRSGPAQILRESRFLNGGGENWGIFILSWPYPFPYLVNTWSPSGKKKKNKQKSVTLYFHFLLSYIYLRSNFTRYFWSSDVYVIINILYRPSTCNAGSQAVYIFWTSFALAFAGLKNAKKNTACSAG